ncbi:hypothetical protein OG705_29040 [Streptomyces sp. NBC_00838]|uniref:hypothetical protein n=1 Tax=Streptomyces sp. NBC_00838 TaxID=2903680 RepID=UPI0038684A66|nr:hypothetical protein OG705_29040 [Streptomyces sp. NBC_00838]
MTPRPDEQDRTELRDLVAKASKRRDEEHERVDAEFGQEIDRLQGRYHGAHQDIADAPDIKPNQILRQTKRYRSWRGACCRLTRDALPFLPGPEPRGQGPEVPVLHLATRPSAPLPGVRRDATHRAAELPHATPRSPGLCRSPTPFGGHREMDAALVGTDQEVGRTGHGVLASRAG